MLNAKKHNARRWRLAVSMHAERSSTHRAQHTGPFGRCQQTLDTTIGLLQLDVELLINHFPCDAHWVSRQVLSGDHASMRESESH
jgi:hypothetical protein